ncbi:MAG: hypothetical protein KYX66_14495 [Blastomonas fulva]|uniref:hypothetical protein n=1 Tax=Blastomonas fulva TaxID=1550728 RepID=UPI0024E22882|nr:hypothetical protein [Blastomonas fulva]MDK2757932.1 hypothetical protein [Blastomonas fulva]
MTGFDQSGTLVDNPQKPIRVSDYCERLHRLYHLDRDDEVDEELDKICRAVFGFCDDDISNADWDALESEFWTTPEAVKEARKFGYDLTLGGFVPLEDADYFWKMVRAKTRGLVPQSANDRIAIRLKNEADDYLIDKSEQ